MRRDYLFWGFVLILLGGLMFLNSANIRLPGGINALQLFWPLLLLIAGAWVILGVVLGGGSGPQKDVVVNLQNASQASLRIGHGAGHLSVTAGSMPGKLLTGKVTPGVGVDSKRSGDRVDARVHSSGLIVPFVNWNGLDWSFELNPEIPIALKLETGASRSDINLLDLKVTDLKVETGASSTNLTLPAKAGTTKVKIELGAAMLDVVVPKDVEARIRVDQGVSAIDIDTSRFSYSNGIYESAGFSSAENRADIKVEAGAGKISIH
jgi:hypothetical protein